MRVLLIEDDPTTSKSIEMMLLSEGFNVYCTDMGEEGLDLGRIYDYDIILLDLNLPDIHGYEVLRELRESKVRTPVMVLTGMKEITNVVKALGKGADDYVTKPFHKQELVARIHAIVRRSQGHAESVIETGKLKLNLDAAFQFAQAVQPAMASAGHGAIVNIASVAGIAGSPGAAHYGAAKAGVINLTRSLALEWAPAIRVNCVAPDFIRTEGTDRLMTDADRERIAGLIPLRRLGAPEDVANAVAFLASDKAAFVTGQTLVVDGGSLFRSRLDFVTDQ